MTSLWHLVLHGSAAAILLAIGIPLLVLSARASQARRPWRISFRPVGDVRAAIFGALAILAFGGLILMVLAAARTQDGVSGALLSTLAAATGAFALHAGRRASFDNVATIPIAGIVGIAMLLAIAGPQAPVAHAHDAAVPAAQPPGTTQPSHSH